MTYRTPTQPWRVGLVVIDNDPIPELEIRPAGDDNVCVVASRFLLNRAPGEIYLGEGEQADLPPGIREALEQLNRIGVDAVGLCFTSSSVFAPATFDRLFANAARAINEEWAVATAARSIIDALASVDSTRPFIVAPPWFSDETVHAVTDYLNHHGISYTGWHRHQLGPGWGAIRQQDLFDNGAGWDIDPSALISQVIQRIPTASDSVLVPGSGFRSGNAQEKLQDLTGVPVVSANTALKQALFAAAPSAPRQ